MPPLILMLWQKKLRIRVEHEDLENDVSGFLVIKEGRSVIVLNKNHPLNRKRFTLAHEIGTSYFAQRTR